MSLHIKLYSTESVTKCMHGCVSPAVIYTAWLLQTSLFVKTDRSLF